MTLPLPKRGRSMPRPRPRWSGWITGTLIALLLPMAAFGGYEAGKRAVAADLWDPLWIRAYWDRPLDSGQPGSGFWVTGYYVDYDRSSLEMVKASANHMDQIIIFGWGFDQEGNLIGRNQELVKAVTSRHKRILLFGNLTNGSFNRETAHAILTDRAVQDRAVANILTKAAELNVAGIQVDFENLASGDREAYTAFLRRLKDELTPKGLSISIAAAAKTSDRLIGWGGATDYAAIGQIVDYFYIMAYDEHWRGGPPGPVASAPWTEQVIRYATGVMPAQKIILGLPFYGYEWSAEPGGNAGTNRAYGSAKMADRVAAAGAQLRWDPVALENIALFRSGDGDRVAWYPDERSLEGKLKMAYQYNLKGVALWRLGLEPDQWWQQMGRFRLQPAK